MTNTNHSKTKGQSDEHYTTKSIFSALNVVFDLDVAAPSGGGNAPALHYYDKESDGLSSQWWGNVWMNPPYSSPTPWVEKWLDHGNGICLVAVSRAKWYDRLWRECDGILNLPPSLKFMTPDGKSKGIFMPCVLASIGAENTDALRLSELGLMR